MKIKIILAVFILMNLFNLTGLHSQTDLTIKIVNSSGVPINGLTSTDIKFIKSPFTGTEVVTGLTITEENGNTLGTYHVSGFTTFQLVELWISGTKYKDFGRKYTGDITNQDLFVINHPYINVGSPLYSNYSDGQFFLSTLVWRGYVEALYGRLGTDNTWSANQIFNGTVTFNGSVSGLTGIPTLTGSNSWSGVNVFGSVGTGFYEPSLLGTSPWLTDYSTWTTHPILSKDINDSLYDTKTTGWVNTKLRRIPVQNYGHPLFDVNGGQFYFDNTTGALTLQQQFVDSLSVKDLTIHNDTSDAFDNQYSKTHNIQRVTDYFKNANSDSSSELVDNYQRIINGVPVSQATFHLVNNTVQTAPINPTPVPLSSITKIDSIILPWDGTYTVQYSATYNFITSKSAVSTDSIQTGLYIFTTHFVALGERPVVTWVYNTTVYSGVTQPTTWKYIITASAGQKVYLLGSEYVFTSSLIHFINQWEIEATLIH